MDNLMIFSVILLWVVVLGLVITMFLLTKSIVRFLNRFNLEGTKRLIAPGKPAPLFREEDHNKTTVRMADFSNRFTILVFTKDECKVCQKLLPELPKLQSDSKIPLRLIMVAPEEVVGEPIQHPSGQDIHFIRADDVIKNYNISQVPALILVDPTGTIVVVYNNGGLKELQNALGIAN